MIPHCKNCHKEIEKDKEFCNEKCKYEYIGKDITELKQKINKNPINKLIENNQSNPGDIKKNKTEDSNESQEVQETKNEKMPSLVDSENKSYLINKKRMIIAASVIVGFLVFWTALGTYWVMSDLQKETSFNINIPENPINVTNQYSNNFPQSPININLNFSNFEDELRKIIREELNQTNST